MTGLEVQIGEYTLGSGIMSAAIAFLASIMALRVFRNILLTRLGKISEKTKTDFDDLLIRLLKGIPWSFYVLASLFMGLQFMAVPAFLNDALGYAVMIVSVYYVILSSQILIDYFRDKLIERRVKTDPKEDPSFIKLLAQIVKVSMWVVGVLLILQNVGINVTALIAGAGIGGLAIALAAQNILDDIFASFSIHFDKPYQIGDFIIIGDDLGMVKKIGIKTSRIDTLRGEELVVSNKEMTSTRIHNFGKMPHRRIDFTFGVTYDTPADKLRWIPGKVKEIIEAQELTRFDRAHFKKFGDSSLVFESVYYLNSSEYNKYMDTQQNINLAIKEELEANGIEFAFPTRTIYMVKD